MKNKNKLYILCYIIKKIINVNKILEKLKKILDTMWYGFKKNKENYNNDIYNVIVFLLLKGECRQEELLKKLY